MIVVSGSPRSGTSLMMQLLSVSGHEIVSDNKREKDENNPNGYFEIEDLVTKMDDPDFINPKENKVIKIIFPLLSKLPKSEEKYKTIFMERHFHEIFKSIIKMKNEDISSIEKRGLVVGIFNTRKYIAERSDFDVTFVSYNNLLKDCKKELESLKDILDIKKCTKVINKKLYRNICV